MKLSKEIYNIISLESLSLTTLAILFIWDWISSYNFNAEHFIQLDTFEQLAHSIIDCNITIDESHDEPANEPNAYASMGDLETTHYPKCPIDLDRLRYFDDPALDTWLSYHHIKHGGHFKPAGCEPKQKVAIIVPYRDKQEHLEKFLLYMHQFLPDQLIDYTIFVIEQADQRDFNRMKLLNIGVSKVIEFQPEICCFIFHEVDLMPLDQRNLYMCSALPRHLSGSISNYRYRLMHPHLLGGVVSMSRAQYELIGGLPDDTLDRFDEYEQVISRIVANNLKVERAPLQYGVYITSHYQWDEQNETLAKMIRELNHKQDETSSRNEALSIHKGGPKESSIVSVELKHLYTHVKCTV